MPALAPAVGKFQIPPGAKPSEPVVVRSVETFDFSLLTSMRDNMFCLFSHRIV